MFGGARAQASTRARERERERGRGRERERECFLTHAARRYTPAVAQPWACARALAGHCGRARRRLVNPPIVRVEQRTITPTHVTRLAEELNHAIVCAAALQQQGPLQRAAAQRPSGRQWSGPRNVARGPQSGPARVLLRMSCPCSRAVFVRRACVVTRRAAARMVARRAAGPVWSRGGPARVVARRAGPRGRTAGRSPHGRAAGPCGREAGRPVWSGGGFARMVARRAGPLFCAIGPRGRWRACYRVRVAGRPAWSRGCPCGRAAGRSVWSHGRLKPASSACCPARKPCVNLA